MQQYWRKILLENTEEEAFLHHHDPFFPAQLKPLSLNHFWKKKILKSTQPDSNSITTVFQKLSFKKNFFVFPQRLFNFIFYISSQTPHKSIFSFQLMILKIFISFNAPVKAKTQIQDTFAFTGLYSRKSLQAFCFSIILKNLFSLNAQWMKCV